MQRIVFAIFALAALSSAVQAANQTAVKPPPELKPCSYRQLAISNFKQCSSIQKLSDVTNVLRVQYAAAGKQSCPHASTYTLMMLDPDALAASCPTMAFIKHWLLTNITANVLARGSNNLEKEPGVVTLQTYLHPTPPSGIHRYQLFLMQQGPSFRPKSPVVDTQPGQIISFDPVQFKTKNSLNVVAAFEFRIDTGTPDDCTHNPFA